MSFWLPEEGMLVSFHRMLIPHSGFQTVWFGHMSGFPIPPLPLLNWRHHRPPRQPQLSPSPQLLPLLMEEGVDDRDSPEAAHPLLSLHSQLSLQLMLHAKATWKVSLPTWKVLTSHAEDTFRDRGVDIIPSSLFLATMPCLLSRYCFLWYFYARLRSSVGPMSPSRHLVPSCNLGIWGS